MNNPLDTDTIVRPTLKALNALLRAFGAKSEGKGVWTLPASGAQLKAYKRGHASYGVILITGHKYWAESAGQSLQNNLDDATIIDCR